MGFLTTALGVGSIASSIFGGGAAKRAARDQANVAGNQLGIEQNIHQITTELFKPYRQRGNRAADALAFELGLGKRPVFGRKTPEITEFEAPVVQSEPTRQGFTNLLDQDESRSRHPGAFTNALAPADPITRFRVNDEEFDTREEAEAFARQNRTGGTPYGGFQETPGYQFQLEQGLNAIDNSAASRGNLFSGATLKASQGFGQGLANQEYNTYLNRLAAQANAGQAAAGNQAAAGSNFAAGAGQALGNIGNSLAAGRIGQSNAYSQGIGNVVGLLNYQNQLAPSGGGGFLGGLFGGGQTPRGNFSSGGIPGLY